MVSTSDYARDPHGGFIHNPYNTDINLVPLMGLIYMYIYEIS